MIAQLNDFSYRLGKWLGALKARIFPASEDDRHQQEQPPEWLEHEDVDYIDEAAWESFPSSDPPALTRDS